MIPVQCQVKHDPENGTHGDCIRACIASLLDKPSADVPHFYHDDCDADTGSERIVDYLVTLNLSPVVVGLPGDKFVRNAALDEFAKSIKDAHYILFGSTGNADHCVICLNNQIVHNPAWAGSKITEPHSSGFWYAMVLACR